MHSFADGRIEAGRLGVGVDGAGRRQFRKEGRESREPRMHILPMALQDLLFRGHRGQSVEVAAERGHGQDDQGEEAVQHQPIRSLRRREQTFVTKQRFHPRGLLGSQRRFRDAAPVS